MNLETKLTSKLDASVNFVFDNGQEARYVERDDYFIVYLSSHGGCNKACRFCHLTQTNQIEFVPSTIEELTNQFNHVFAHYIELMEIGNKPPKKMHINFMARGEPLSHPGLTGYWPALTRHWVDTANLFGIVQVKVKISTIIPRYATNLDFEGAILPDLYYSLYSMNPVFRKRWLPNARDPSRASYKLKEWQVRTGGRVVLHGALIANENDSIEDAKKIVDFLELDRLKVDVNIVRYNPYSEAQGVESSELQRAAYIEILKKSPNISRIKVVDRVGTDVYASCGMFIELK